MGKDKRNLHKFVSFTEHISKLRIDVIHKIEKRTETPDDSETFFQQCLAKWSELDCSLDFQAFKKEIFALVKSLSLLVYHQKTIVEILQRYLKKKESLALDALLELCVELSRDLQGDFCTYFTEFLQIISTHLETKDARKIENCFKTLAYLFKFQWRYLVKDMKALFRVYSPLLSEDQAAHKYQFAAESFAFLVRKTKDLSGLFEDMFENVVENRRLCPGIGRLLAETVRGVQNQFHSCTEKVLSTLFSQCLLNNVLQKDVMEDFHEKQVFKVFACMFNEMAKYTRKIHTQVVWDCLINGISRNIHGSEGQTNLEHDRLCILIKLIDVWTEWKAGALILNPVQLCETICKLMNQTTMSAYLKTSLLKLLSSLLLANCPELNECYERKLLYEVFSGHCFSILDICQFIQHVRQWFGFMDNILPKLVTFIEMKLLDQSLKSSEVNEVLFVLAGVIVDQVSFEEGFNKKVPETGITFCCSKLSGKKGQALLMKFFKLDFNQHSEDLMETVWSSLVCLPFVRPLEVQTVLQSIVKLLTHLKEKASSSNENKQVLFVLSEGIKCLSMLCHFHRKTLEEILLFDVLLNILREHPSDVHVLQAFHVYLSVVKGQSSCSSILSSQNLLLVYPYLEKNLSSHARLVRLLTLKVLTIFQQISVDDDQNNDTGSLICRVFDDCLEAESVPVTFSDYRQKLIILQKLVYSNTRHLPEDIKEAPLRYLIGILYVNLSTLWDPVISMITTHAVEENKKLFWDVFHQYLTQASCDTDESKKDQCIPASSLSSLSRFFQQQSQVCIALREDNRVDNKNFRLLLWKAMTKFPQIVEPHSRQVVPLFLNFVRSECSLIDEGCRISYQDLTKAEDGPSELDDVPTKADQTEMNFIVDKKDGEKDVKNYVDDPSRTGSARPVRMKTLCVCLTLFGLFKNPKRLYQEPMVKQLYLKLLTQKDSELQKLALSCLMTYKLDYLLPYKENLDRLLEDKTFKDELMCFSSSEELNVVTKEHRGDLLTILIRILYGKMQRWTGAGTRGKAGSTARRSFVLRFLNSCHGDEMKVFMQLISEAFKEMFVGNGSAMTKHRLTKVVSLRKQIGFLNMFSQVIQQLGVQAMQHLPGLLKVLFYCLTVAKEALEQREKIKLGHLANLKSVRQLGIKCLVKFFEAFPGFDISLIVDDVFNLAVWPQITSLRNESLQSPTGLLRLLNSWSKNPRFFPLLSRVPPGSNEGLLSHVFACLSSDYVKAPVVTMVMEIAQRLLSQSSTGSDSEESSLMHLGCELRGEAVSGDEPLSYGCRLVLPHVSVLLDYLNKSVKRTSKDLANAKGKLSKVSNVSKLELSVLSKISPFIVNPDHCLVLVRLIIPILNVTRKEEAQLGMLRSISNLLRNVDTPAIFFKPLSRLFSTVHQRESRSELCQVFSNLAEKSGMLREELKLLHALNSWNQKQLDEPDFEARLDAFSQAGKLVQDGVLEAEIVMPFLFNASYFAMRTTDLALRYSAVAFIRTVVERVSKDESGTWFDVIVLQCLLPAVREAVKSRQEGARNEFVQILGNLVKRFEHSSLVDLKPLTNEDPEVDFFENIVHIQVHRRVRALRRLTSTCEETSFSTHSLSFFILPLITHFVYEYKSAKDHNVITEAINAISAVSRQLTWQKYCNLLRHYLRILPREKEMQKVIVRIVVSILESFHFDLKTLLDTDIEGAGDKDDASSEKDNDLKETKGEEENEKDDEAETLNETKNVEDCPFKLKLKIHKTITTRILPQLHKCLTKKIESSDFHRLSGRKEDDEEEILRVPIVLAMVKLLQSLPKKTLETNLPGLLIRVCQALKSRAFEVRETARRTLSNITNSLGILYFPFILKELRSSLVKSYQLHVLASTLHYVLSKFEEHIPDGGLDISVRSMVEVLIDDLFGEPAREREVDKITTKLQEAKSTKSFESFELLAKKISATQLMTIITPLKEVLDETQNHKTSQRSEEVLRRISIGLQKNLAFSPEQMLVFVHGLINERLPLVQKNKRPWEDSMEKQDFPLQHSDTYIIPAKPSRSGRAPELSQKTNAYVLVTFGLQLLLTALKRQKLVSSEQKHVEMLDPFVAVLSDALHSDHVKITTLALRCLCWVVKFPLPSLKDHVLQIASRLFKLLKLYARTGAASGDNYEMVLSAFKTITVLLRDFAELKVTERQLRILLTFVEEDIHDYTRQSSAFPLLKAILSRKLQVAEINDVMLKVAELSVTNNSSSVQLQCRQVLLQFLLDYPLGKKLQRYLEFFVSQLGYEQSSGRESTLEMILAIITSFPEKAVYTHSGLFFLPLCTRLINDESVTCRKLTAVAVKTLLDKLDVERRDNLFAIVMTWMNDEKISVKRLACHVCGLFVEVEAQSFDRRLSDVLPLVFDIIHPESYGEKESPEEDLVEEGQESLKDHLLINALSTLAKVLQKCSVFKRGKTQMNNEWWDSILSHLLFPHAWVRVMSSRLFGLLFSQKTPEEIIKLSGEINPREYLAVDLNKKVFVLSEAFLDQLKAPNLSDELGEQIVKNLFYLSKIIVLINKEKCASKSGIKDYDMACSELTLSWLLKRMCNISKFEASQTPKLKQKRLVVLRWIAAVGSYMGRDDILPYLTQMLKPVYRELDGKNTGEKLHNLSQEVAELFKSLVGLEAFSHAYSRVKQNASETREKRKMQIAFEAVANPEASVAKKMKRNMAKKECRKRKLDAKKPSRRIKKAKTE